MRWDDLLNKVQKLPLINAEVLLAGVSNPKAIQVQLCRWVKTGKLLKLKNNLFILSSQYRREEPFDFYIASVLNEPSYISREKALEYYGLIPESVPIFTCVSTKRPGKITTPIGIFDYRHIKNDLFWGYETIILNNQTAFMALPEKALLDLFYFNHVEADFSYFHEMRLQNLDKINLEKLLEMARKFQSVKILRIAKRMKKFIEA